MLEMSWKKELMIESQKVAEDCKCSACGGQSSNETLDCAYCGNENLKLKEEIKKISEIFGNLSEEELNGSFVMISLMKLGKYSRQVSDLTERKITNSYLSWSKKIIKDLVSAKELSVEDQESLINLFGNGDYCQDQIATILQNYIIANTASQVAHYSPEVVYGALQQCCCQIIKPFEKLAKMEKVKLEENKVGDTLAYTVRINETHFDNFIHHGGTSILNTLGHEARHIYQNYKQVRRIVEDRNDLIMFYESIISNRNQKIYDDNYFHMLLEIDARVYGLRFEQKFSEEMFNFFDDSKKKEYAADYALLTSCDTIRVIDDKKIHLEEEVLSVLNEEPDLYDRCPQFRYEFVKDNGHIRFKTTQELVDDYVYHDNSKKDNLYLELVVNSKNREDAMKNRQQTSSNVTI